MTEWELLNDNKALWLRNPSEVTEEEHAKFYKALAKVSGIPFHALSSVAEERERMIDMTAPGVGELDEPGCLQPPPRLLHD